MLQDTMVTDLEILEQLNTDYIQSFLKSDVERYDQLLADDFICITPSGQLIDKAAFLQAASAPVVMDDFHAEDIQIRIFGDFAQIMALTPYKITEGKEGVNRYIDCWAKRDGQWLAISAQITRVA